jgi:peptide methionine sulfoxide reductase MsrB
MATSVEDISYVTENKATVKAGKDKEQESIQSTLLDEDPRKRSLDDQFETLRTKNRAPPMQVPESPGRSSTQNESVVSMTPITSSHGRSAESAPTMTRSVSFESPEAMNTPSTLPTLPMPRSLSSHSARRRMHEVDGRPLDHWDNKNFEKKRDETCRVVYHPKEGNKFFQKNLPSEDYEVMKSFSLEQPFYSKYNRFFPKRGHFCCKACGNALYAAMVKFDAEDGWPAFGACVEGAIGIIPSEKRRAEVEREDQACIKLQAFFRGVLCRMRVTKMLEDMINELLEQKQMKDHSPANETAAINFKVKSPLFSPTTVKQKIGKTKGLQYTLLRVLGDDYTEIHCHRCKSHLGDVLEDNNIGRNDQVFRERHRVNGRALKYVEDDLPKRINVESSLLFADSAKRRLLGLPAPREKETLAIPLRSFPFVSPRAQRKKLLRSSGIASDPLSVSCHASLQGNNRMPRRNKVDSLSVSSHEMLGGELGNASTRRRKSGFDSLSVSCHESISSSFNDRPSGRRGRVRGVKLQEKRASLEKFMLSKSMH